MCILLPWWLSEASSFATFRFFNYLFLSRTMLVQFKVLRKHNKCRNDIETDTTTTTSLVMCCKVLRISENSGLDRGSCCQHFSINSTNIGWVFTGIVGLRPCSFTLENSSTRKSKTSTDTVIQILTTSMSWRKICVHM